MQIKTNKRYLTRGGKIATVVGTSNIYCTYPHTVDCGDLKYSVTKDGLRYEFEEDEFDLISKFKLRENTQYVLANGNSVELKLSAFYRKGDEYKFRGTNNFSYTRKGTINSIAPSEWDIVGIVNIGVKESDYNHMIGKKFLNKLGEICTIVSVVGDDSFYKLRYSYNNSNNIFAISLDGRLYLDDVSENDLDMSKEFEFEIGELYIDKYGIVYKCMNENELYCIKSAEWENINDIQILRKFKGVEIIVGATYRDEAGTAWEAIYNCTNGNRVMIDKESESRIRIVDKMGKQVPGDTYCRGDMLYVAD